MAQILTKVGFDVLKALEGCRLKAYQCAADVWTIGYGHTGPDVKEGLVIDEEDAARLLARDARAAEDAVDELVSVPLGINQFDALVLFVFNIGRKAFEGSTILRLLNQGDYDAAADEFPKWRKAGGRVLAPLEKRRAVERHIFLHGEYDKTPYDGDLSDAVIAAEDRAPVDRPSSDIKPRLEGSRTIDASRKSFIAMLVPMIALVNELLGQLGEFQEKASLGLVLPALGVVAVGFLLWQLGRIVHARYDDFLRAKR